MQVKQIARWWPTIPAAVIAFLVGYSVGGHVWMNTLSLAAVVQASATVVLVGVTWLYVRHTKRLVDANREGLSDARALLEAETGIGRRRFQESIYQFVRVLDTLDGRSIAEGRLRRAAMWSQSDEQRFTDLAAAMGSSAAKLATETAASLRWIRLLHGRVIKISPLHGYVQDAKENAEYVEHYGIATSKLNELQRLAAEDWRDE